MAALTPQVFWAQRHTEIYLRVELSDAKVGQSPVNGLLTYLNLACPALLMCLMFRNFILLMLWGGRLASHLVLAGHLRNTVNLTVSLVMASP